MRETIIKGGIVFILVLLAIGVVSGIAGIGRYTTAQSSDPGMAMPIRYHNYNPGNYPVKVNANANANHFAVKPVPVPVTLPQFYHRTPQMYHKNKNNPNFTKIANYYTRWSPMVRDNHGWVFKNRFVPGTINPYGYVQHKHKPVSEPEEPEPEPEPQPEPQPEHELTVLEQPDWKVGDWWTVSFTYRAVWQAVPLPLCSWIAEKYKFEVVDIVNIDGKDCYVVRVGNEFLYFKKENASPIISGNILAPFDFPAFPLERNVTRTYGGIQQSVSVDTFTKKDGNSVKCFKVSLQRPCTSQNVTQYWQPGAPWWIYEEKGDMVKAWLVDWGHEEVHEEVKKNFSELYPH